MSTLDTFTKAYVTCALWSSTGDDGEPLDDNFSSDDIAPELLASIIADCAKFQVDNAAALAALEDDSRVSLSGDGSSVLSHAGHDFWLNRVGHGAGFWDGDWPEPYATQLDKSARSFRGMDLSVGDDNKIYGM